MPREEEEEKKPLVKKEQAREVRPTPVDKKRVEQLAKIRNDGDVGEFLKDVLNECGDLTTESIERVGTGSRSESSSIQDIFQRALEIEWDPAWFKDKATSEKNTKQYREWFDGMPEDLRKGIGRAKAWDTEGEGERDVPPAYYAESSKPVRYVKAFAMALSTVVPYFAIFDSLSVVKPQTWIPCSNHSCHYIRLFNSENLPGTGSNVISVENGIERPVAMNYIHFDVYSCGHKKESDDPRTYGQKLQFWNANGASCPDPCHHCAHQGHNNSLTHEMVHQEQKRADHWTGSLKLSFYATKAVYWTCSAPVNLFAKVKEKWGMEHVPSARCPGMSSQKMKDTCAKIETKRNVVNHLAAWGPCKYLVYFCLVAYALLQGVHDILLMKYTNWENVTLAIAAAATASLGVATGAVFFWAMGATEVFVAPVEGFDKSECMCYYQLPEMTALLGLATPFALYAVFRAQVQMRGLACLYGDYLSFITFIIPHYLARQSFLWTWGTLVTPKAAGTVATAGGSRRPVVKEWKWMRTIQNTLYNQCNILSVLVALSASSFMISFKEVCVSMYKSDEYSPFIANIIKYGLLPLPTLACVGIGGYAMKELWDTTINLEAGESMVGQYKTLFPSCIADLCCPKKTSRLTPEQQNRDWYLRVASFTLGSIALAGFTFAAGQGLCPDFSFLTDFSGKVDLEWTSLAQAELWSACGFAFFLVHMPRILTIAFSTWDDLESLNNLAENQERQRSNSQDGYSLAENAP